MPLSDEARAELRALAQSGELRESGRRLRAGHGEFFLTPGGVNCDRVIDFLTGYSEFLAGAPRPRRLFTERVMKL